MPLSDWLPKLLTDPQQPDSNFAFGADASASQYPVPGLLVSDPRDFAPGGQYDNSQASPDLSPPATTLLGYSGNGLVLTESFEGCRLEAYQDTAGIWTIGYGHTSNVQQGMSCTQAQAEQWLLEDVEACVNWLNECVTPQVELTQGEFDALVDFSFNLGLHALAGSTLLKEVLADKMALAAAEFAKWDKAGGQVVAGLLRRRLAEQQEFTT